MRVLPMMMVVRGAVTRCLYRHTVLARLPTLYNTRRTLASNNDEDEFKALKPVRPPVYLPGENGQTATQLYVAAARDDAVEKVVNDLEALAAGKHADLIKFVETLDTEKYSLNQVHQVVFDKAVAGKLHKVSADFFASLVKKGTLRQLEPVSSALQELFLVSKGYDIAQVTSAQELSAKEKESLSAALSKEHAKTGKKLHLRYNVTPSILAGFTVQINEHFWDFSIETQLKEALARN